LIFLVDFDLLIHIVTGGILIILEEQLGRSLLQDKRLESKRNGRSLE
jgi:hypothetical protein